MSRFFSIFSVFIFFLACKERGEEVSQLTSHIPKEASLIIKINKPAFFKKEFSSHPFSKTWVATSLYKSVEERLSALAGINAKEEALLCFTEIGKQNIEYVFITKYHENIIVTDSIPEKSIERLLYNGETIEKITMGNQALYTAVVDGIFLGASSQLLVENSIRQRNKGIVKVDEAFQKLYTIANPGKPATVFINHERLPSLLTPVLEERLSNYIRNFADWTVMDIALTPTSINGSGVTVTKTASSKTSALFHNTHPQEPIAPHFTSLIAEGFVSFTFDSATQFQSNLLQPTQNKAAYMHRELIEPLTEIACIAEAGARHVVVHSSDIENTKKRLVQETLPVLVVRDFAIYKATNAGWLKEAFPATLPLAAANFYVFIDDCVVFSTDIKALQTLLVNYLNKATLAFDEAYRGVASRLSDVSSLLVVGLSPNYKDFVKDGFRKSYRKDTDNMGAEAYPLVIWQAVQDGDVTHVHTTLAKTDAPLGGKRVTQVAAIGLDADAVASPQWVTNYSTQQKELVVQDVENTLYLISHSGKILWKKKLDSAIKGSVQEVDLYRNGRIQWTFATEKSWYVIDRNGKDVAPFPIRFEKPITQPLAVFDYDLNKKYRFLLCQGNVLKMYDGKGNIVSGFAFTRAQAPVVHTPKHIRMGKEDYIVISEENGSLRILDRTGKTKISVKDKIDFSENEVYEHQGKFIIGMRNGNVLQINPAGKVITQKTAFPQPYYLRPSHATWISMAENTLTIGAKKLVLDFGVYTEPRLFRYKNAFYVAVTDTQTHKVYIYTDKGELLPHFPVYGTTAIDMADADLNKKPEFAVLSDSHTVIIYKIQ